MTLNQKQIDWHPGNFQIIQNTILAFIFHNYAF